jgi:cysteine synthase
MRIVVTGGRNFDDEQYLRKHLDAIHKKSPVTQLIHGAASGADSLAARWASDRAIPQVAVPANWKAHGRAAGPIRNGEMLLDYEPDLVVAFKGGAGTADCIRQAEFSRIRVVRTWEIDS